MSKVPFQNVILQTLPGGGWEVTGSQPVQESPAQAPVKPVPTIIERESAKIDVKLIRAYKLRAAQEGKFIYEVMEDALKAYLKH
jgi:hypothetical protein